MAVQPTYLLSSVKQASMWETRLRTWDLAEESCPFERCDRKAGIAIAARIPMIRMTTRSSMRVKPRSSERRLETFRVMSEGRPEGEGRGLEKTRGGHSGPPLDLSGCSSAGADYHLVLVGQPPLPAGVQARSSGTPAACVMVNVWFVPPVSAFDVARMT